MACGVVISAPAVVMSVILGLDVTTTCLLIGIPTTIFTMFGGVRAVAYTDVKQMVHRRRSGAAVVMLVSGLPDDVGFFDALHVAGATGRMQMFDFRFDITQQYTFWSGTIAALFLFCSYFGTDQSQVQRYLRRQVGGRSPHLAADERLLEDSAADARAPRRRADVRVLPVHASADAVQSGARTQVRASGKAAEYAALEAQFRQAVDGGSAARQLLHARGRGRRERRRGGRAGDIQGSDEDVKAIRERAAAIVRDDRVMRRTAT